MDSGGALQSWYAVRTPGSRLLVYLVAATTVTASGAVAEIPAAGRESRSWRDELRTRFESGQAQTGLTIDYPLDETLFPPEIAAPTFRWTDAASGANTWLVTVEVADGMPGVQGIAQSPEWTPREDDWESLKRRSVAGEARLTVLGFARDDRSALLSGAQVRFGTSRDEVGAPLFYREVNLPFSDAVKDPTTIRWRFGSVASMEPPPIVLEGLPVCGNCHSFSTDGRLLGMDVDYANDKGSYALTRVSEEIVLGNQDIITWSDFRRDERNPTFGLLSQVSPDGAYVVSTVKDRSVFVAQPDLAFSQLFFPIRGILAIYQRESGTFAPLPGADDPTFVQSNPTWSPDGETIVFARAKAHRLARDEGKVLLTRQECEEFLEGGQTFQYDLYSIPFNDGAGGTPQPLAGASANGMSNYFPKYSPDGKWIVFCRSKSFMLLQPDSELYIVPAGGGQARRLRCNTARMNSWHSWSPNGKWLVFASKANSPYTQLCLTHIDEQGRSTLLLNSLVQFGARLALVGAAVTGIIVAIQDALAAIDEFLLRVVDGIASLFGRASEEADASLDQIEGSAADSFDAIDQAASDSGDSISEWMSDAADAIRAAFDSAIAWVRDAFIGLGDVVEGILNRIVSLLNDVIDAARRALRALSSVGGRSEGGPSFSGGGHVRGPGTSTSDSIPAWLSRNEFVIKAAAVRKYGLAAMTAINSMRLPVGGIRGFAIGGLVDGFTATGGAAPSLSGVVEAAPAPAGRPFSLTIGGETFSGLLAPEDVAEKMISFATTRQIRSTGQMPSWFEG